MKQTLAILTMLLASIPLAFGQERVADFTDAPYGVPYHKTTTDNESATYLTTANGSILGPAGDEIAKAEKGTSIAARFTYLTDIRIANALSEAANRGAIVMVLLAAKPPIKDYRAPAYLARNGISVFLDNSMGAETGTENFIVLNESATCLVLSVPPDSKKESLPASLLILRNAVSTRNALLGAFRKSLEDKSQVAPFNPSSAPATNPNPASQGPQSKQK